MARNLAIGDIHGCLDALLTLVEFAKVTDEDKLITVGDYVDRGPDSKGVIEWLLERHRCNQLVPLRGNHDIMMLEARQNEDKCQRFIQVGGSTTLDSYGLNGSPAKLTDIPKQHWDFLENDLLPFYESEKHFFVHGNVYPEIPLSSQPDFMLYWEKYNDPPPHESGKTMICGHTAQKSGVPRYNEHSICIDTRAYGHGWLTCLDPDSRFVWQANQAGEVRKFFLDESDQYR